MGCIKAPIAVELPLFAGNPRSHATFDGAEVCADQHRAGRYADHGADAVAYDGKRFGVELFDVLIVPGCDGGDCFVEIVNNRTFQVLSLKSFATKAPGGRAVIAKGAADTIVSAGTSKQGVNLLDCCLRTAEPKFEHTLDLWRQVIFLQLPLNRFPIEALQIAALTLQPRHQLRHLIDGGDIAVGDLRDLSVDLWSSLLGNCTGRFSESAIYTEASLIDRIAKLPRGLF